MTGLIAQIALNQIHPKIENGSDRYKIFPFNHLLRIPMGFYFAQVISPNLLQFDERKQNPKKQQHLIPVRERCYRQRNINQKQQYD
jgi:hypothetical protein